MRKRTKPIFAFLMSLLFTVSLIACNASTETSSSTDGTPQVAASKSEDPAKEGSSTDAESPLAGLTLSLATFQSYKTPGMEAAIAYVEEQTGCKIDYQTYPDDQYDNLLKTKLVTGDAPDIFGYWPVAKLLPEDKIAQLEGDWIDKVTDPVLKEKTIARPGTGVVVSAPYACAVSQGIIYNKELFAKAGVTEMPLKTYDEFVEACEKIQAIGVTPIYLPNKEAGAASVFMLTTYPVFFEKNQQVAADIVSHKINFADVPELVMINERVLDLKKYMNEDYMSATMAMGLEALTSGNAAMIPGADHYYNAIKRDYPDQLDNTGFTTFTALDEGFCAIAGGSDHGLFVASENKHVPEAKEFINWFMSEPSLQLYYEKNPGMCPIMEYDTARTPWNAEFVTIGEQSFFTGHYHNTYFSDINTGQFAIVGQNLFGGRSPKEALMDYDMQIEPLNKGERRPGWE